MKLAKLNGRGEIFYSIQGEGRSTGRPSVFVRSSLCNLHCVWCDTDYTWNWRGTRFRHDQDGERTYRKYAKAQQIIDMRSAEVVREVLALPCERLVVTGGEPLLQQDDWVEIMAALREVKPGFWFEVETNGTVVPSMRFDRLVNQYSVSPKLANSGNSVRSREKKDAYEFFSRNDRAFFKYVIVDDEDLAEMLSVVERYAISSGRVFLMPEGTSAAQLRKRQASIVEMCKLHGFAYSDRLHVRLYGARRGV